MSNKTSTRNKSGDKCLCNASDITDRKFGTTVTGLVKTTSMHC